MVCAWGRRIGSPGGGGPHSAALPTSRPPSRSPAPATSPHGYFSRPWRLSASGTRLSHAFFGVATFLRCGDFSFDERRLTKGATTMAAENAAIGNGMMESWGQRVQPVTRAQARPRRAATCWRGCRVPPPCPRWTSAATAPSATSRPGWRGSRPRWRPHGAAASWASCACATRRGWSSGCKGPAIAKMQARQAVLSEQCKTAEAEIRLRATVQSGEVGAQRHKIEWNEVNRQRLTGELHEPGHDHTGPRPVPPRRSRRLPSLRRCLRT